MPDAPYTRDNPSPHYEQLLDQYRLIKGMDWMRTPGEEAFHGKSLVPHLPKIHVAVAEFGVKSILDYGSGEGRYWKVPKGVELALYDPAMPGLGTLPEGRFDMVVCTDVLEHLHEDDIPWILDEICGKARKVVYFSVATRPAKKSLPDGRNAHITVRDIDWWTAVVGAAAAEHKGLVVMLTE